MIACIIPTYDSLPTLKKLVKNIFDYTEDFRIYVIEDGQKKATLNWLKKQDIYTIGHHENKGVAVSWNDGLRQAKADGCTHFAVMNDDIELPPDWQKCLKEFKRAHLVSIKTDLPNTVIAGWFFVLDLEALDKVGYFDEQFSPFFWEDIDYGVRYQRSRLAYSIINLNIFHHGGITTYGKMKDKQKAVFELNRTRFQKKYPDIRLCV